MSKQTKLWHNIIFGDADLGMYGLLDVVLDEYRLEDPSEFDVLLLLNVIRFAAIERDIKYFKSVAFSEHCWLLRLNKRDIMQIVKQTWE